MSEIDSLEREESDLVANRPSFPFSQRGYYDGKDYDARIARVRLKIAVLRHGELSAEVRSARRAPDLAEYVGD